MLFKPWMTFSIQYLLRSWPSVSPGAWTCTFYPEYGMYIVTRWQCQTAGLHFVLSRCNVSWFVHPGDDIIIVCGIMSIFWLSDQCKYCEWYKVKTSDQLWIHDIELFITVPLHNNVIIYCSLGFLLYYFILKRAYILIITEGLINHILIKKAVLIILTTTWGSTWVN